MKLTRRTYLTINDAIGDTSIVNLDMLFERYGVPRLYASFREQFNSNIAVATEFYTHYLYPRFCDSAICYVDTLPMDEPTEQEKYKAFHTVFYRMFSWLHSTTMKYGYLIQKNEKSLYEDTLLNDVKTTNKVKFNDTPQDNTEVGSDNFNTHITTTETSNEGATKMQRLNEIARLYEDLYNRWSNEFDEKFIITEY